MAHEHWPLFGLTITTPRLTLRYIDDDLAHELVAVAAAGIHDPSVMPFLVPWTDQPSPRLEQEAMRFYWRTRADTTPAAWALRFAVITDGKVIGASDVLAEEFPRLRQFETGSWLGREFQGQGFGKEMRLASLAMGFEGLDAQWATTGAWHDNAASLGVTKALGYEQTGERRTLRRDVADTILAFRMDRARWEEIRRDDITLGGVDDAREFLGL